jgi:hypothetical protein
MKVLVVARVIPARALPVRSALGHLSRHIIS